MKTKTYTAGIDMILHDNEIYLIELSSSTYPNNYYMHSQRHGYIIYKETGSSIGGENSVMRITNSTDKLKGVHKLDRQQFFKGVSVEELAEKWVFETNGMKWSNNDNTAPDNYGSFIAGYNANKGVYTLEQLKEAMNLSYECGEQGKHSMPEIIAKITAITLPKSVELYNNKIINITW